MFIVVYLREDWWSRAWFTDSGTPHVTAHPWSPAIMRCECGLLMSLWCRSKDVLIPEIRHKKTPCIGDQTQNTNSRHRPVTQNMLWQKSVSRMTDYIAEREFYLHWSLHYLVCDHMDCALAMVPRTDWGQMFLFATVWVQIRIDNHKQDQSRITDYPVWCHRCPNQPQPTRRVFSSWFLLLDRIGSVHILSCANFYIMMKMIIPKSDPRLDLANWTIMRGC